MFKHKKIWIPLLTTFLMIMPFMAQAADSDTSKQIQEIFTYLNVFLLAIQAFLWPILLLMGSLLNNDLLFSGGMLTTLLNIWAAVRDFVNVMFVLGLVAIAVANIAGLGGDKVAIKSVLPKIIIALIAVNFSFLGCKVVLDVVNVGTTAIYSIPLASDSLKKYSDTTDPGYIAAQANLSQKMCDKMFEQQAEASSAPNASTTTATGNTPYNLFCQPVAATTSPSVSGATVAKNQLTDYGKAFFSTFNSRNAALVMAVELQDIVNLDNIKPGALHDIKDLAINAIFSIIFFVIYATAFVALFAALLVRVVVLWLSIAISPLSFLGNAFDAVKAKFGDNDPLKLFMKHAIVPLPVAMVLTVGMIMISQLKNFSSEAIGSIDPSSLGAITTGMSTIQQMIAGLATAAFIWTAAFMAMAGTKADFLVNPIKGAVQGLGTSIAKLPFYVPVLPVKGTKVGLAAVTQGLGAPQRFINGQQSIITNLFGDQKDKNRDIVKNANSAAATRTAIARIISESPTGLDKDSQAAIAAALNKHLKDKFVVPASVYNGNKADFIKALEEGQVKAEDLNAFLRANQDFKAPAYDTTQTKHDANQANAAANQITDKTPDLQTKLKDLTDRSKELDEAEKNQNLPKIATLKTEVENLTSQVNKLNEAHRALSGARFTGFLTSDNHFINDQTQLRVLNTAYKNAETHAGPQAAQNVLIQRIRDAHITGVSDNDISILANNIINNTPPPAPPAPHP